MKIFNDRLDAGKQLATKLLIYKSNPDAVVIALPRGGVAVGFEVAKALSLPLDILASRKVGFPGNPELAVGAVTFDGQVALNDKMLKEFGINQADLQDSIKAEKREASRRMEVYRVDRTPLNLANKIIILIDDGIATGATVIAAIKSLRQMQVRKIVLAIPVLPAEEVKNLSQFCDELIFEMAPKYFEAIGAVYADFPQLSDDQVINMMRESANFGTEVK